MTHFTSLPEAIHKEIFAEWLTIRDIGQLDSAFCNHKIRHEILLNIFLDPHFLLSAECMDAYDGPVIFPNYACVKWTTLRKIKLKTLRFLDDGKLPDRSFDSSKIESFSIKQKSHLSTVENNELVKFVNSMTKVTVLELQVVKRYSFNNIKNEIWNQLLFLHLTIGLSDTLLWPV